MKKFAFRLAFASAGLVLLTGGLTAVQAQGPGSGGPSPAAPTGVPIDGGASLLLASGAAYGLKRLRAAKQRRQDQPR